MQRLRVGHRRLGIQDQDVHGPYLLLAVHLRSKAQDGKKEERGGVETKLNLYVLDIETTDLEPARGRIVEVGIARVDLERRKVFAEYGSIVNCRLNADERQAWVFEHSDLTPEDVETSPHSGWAIANDIQWHYMPRGVFTSYNESFDFPWLNEKWRIMPNLTLDIMEAVKDNYGRRLSAEAAYRYYCPENPARLPQMTEDHRALSDAVMESYILLALCKEDGKYSRYIEQDLVTE